MTLNPLPIICATLVSGLGDPSGIEALQATAWNRPDAESRLEAFLGSTPSDDPNRLAATVSLRYLSMARSDYQQADVWNRQASELAGRYLPHLADELLDAPPQIAQIQEDAVPITWGLLGLPRVDAKFGTARVSALVDTGAEYAVITESVARRAGLTPRLDSVAVGGSAGRSVRARVTLTGITLGRSQFFNAVVIIVPDNALAFPMGLKIDAIIGMPQLRAFAALEFSQQSLRLFTMATSEQALKPNISFDGWRLMAPVLVDSDPAWMQIDTGARRSSLYILTDDAAHLDSAITVRGLGGSRRVKGQTGQATLQLAGQSVTVSELQRRVLDKLPEGCRAPGPHSLVGQDLLRNKAYRINFTTMRLEWLP